MKEKISKSPQYFKVFHDAQYLWVKSAVEQWGFFIIIAANFDVKNKKKPHTYLLFYFLSWLYNLHFKCSLRWKMSVL